MYLNTHDTTPYTSKHHVRPFKSAPSTKPKQQRPDGTLSRRELQRIIAEMLG